jgi:hypothetical protein
MSGASAPLPYSMRDVDGGAYNNAKFRQRSRLKVLTRSTRPFPLETTLYADFVDLPRNLVSVAFAAVIPEPVRCGGWIRLHNTIGLFPFSYLSRRACSGFEGLVSLDLWIYLLPCSFWLAWSSALRVVGTDLAC